MAIPLTYNLRSMIVRKATTIATALGIALVVFVLASVMMLVNGIKKAMNSASAPDNAIVMSQGSEFELSSSFEESSVNTIVSQPQVKKDANGPVAATEIVVVALLEKTGTTGFSNVTLRGITPASMHLRPHFKIIDGNAPKPDTDEAIVGRAARGRFKGLDIGQSFELTRGRRVRVVGVFDDDGSQYESEVWADRKLLGAAFGREGIVSSVRLQLESPAAFDAFQSTIEHDKRLGLQVLRESTYQNNLSSGLTPLISILGGAVSFFFAVGAMLGAMVTMYAAVANRTREIGTLRALGFSRPAILFAFLTESVSLTLIGGIVGVLAAMAMKFAKFSMMATGTWSEITFSFEPTPQVIVVALGFAAMLGIFGGLLPAIRAAKILPAEAMRHR